jgi:hypothetical protein
MKDISDVMQLVKERDQLKKEKKEIHDKIQDLTKQISLVCTHPVITKERHYSSGGYDYVSSVTITETCVVCGEVVNQYDDPNHKGYHG